MKASRASADVHINEDLTGRQVHINKKHMEWSNSKHNKSSMQIWTQRNLIFFMLIRFPTKMHSNIQDLIHIAYICCPNHDLRIVIKTIFFLSKWCHLCTTFWLLKIWCTKQNKFESRIRRDYCFMCERVYYFRKTLSLEILQWMLLGQQR